MIPVDLMGVLASVVCFLTLVVLFKHIDLQIRINNILDVQLTANKEKEQDEKKRGDSDGQSDSPLIYLGKEYNLSVSSLLFYIIQEYSQKGDCNRMIEVALVGSCVMLVGVLGGQVVLSKRIKQPTK